jgi:hypothetical protein
LLPTQVIILFVATDAVVASPARVATKVPLLALRRAAKALALSALCRCVASGGSASPYVADANFVASVA